MTTTYIPAPDELPVQLVQDEGGNFHVVLDYGDGLRVGIPVEKIDGIVDVGFYGLRRAFAGNAPSSGATH